LVDNLYQVLLNRTPAAVEVDQWSAAVKAGLTPAEVARSFLSSPEYLTNLVSVRRKNGIFSICHQPGSW
jgi:hypothetical protein